MFAVPGASTGSWRLCASAPCPSEEPCSDLATAAWRWRASRRAPPGGAGLTGGAGGGKAEVCGATFSPAVLSVSASGIAVSATGGGGGGGGGGGVAVGVAVSGGGALGAGGGGGVAARVAGGGGRGGGGARGRGGARPARAAAG